MSVLTDMSFGFGDFSNHHFEIGRSLASSCTVVQLYRRSPPSKQLLPSLVVAVSKELVVYKQNGRTEPLILIRIVNIINSL